MKAVLARRYGTVTVEDVPDPAPRSGQVLVEVEASTISAGDLRMAYGQFPRGMALPGPAGAGWSA